MAKNLIDSGHDIVVYDIFTEAVDELKQHGAKSAESPAVVASQAKRIITMLPSRFVYTSQATSRVGMGLSLTGYITKMSHSLLCRVY